MIRMTFRKMARNKWMVLCLLVGAVLTVALTGSIPVFSDAILQRMLTRDLETSQTTSKVFPGSWQVNLRPLFINKSEELMKTFNTFDDKLNSEFLPSWNLPVTTSTRNVSGEVMNL